jgi:hypothetical protein
MSQTKAITPSPVNFEHSAFASQEPRLMYLQVSRVLVEHQYRVEQTTRRSAVHTDFSQPTNATQLEEVHSEDFI